MSDTPKPESRGTEPAQAGSVQRPGYAHALWEHMANEHNLSLLESELADIMNHCEGEWRKRYELEAQARRHDLQERGLPAAWVRKYNKKLYYLVGTHVFAGKPMVWLHDGDSNKALHITVESLCRTMKPVRPSDEA